MPVQPSYRGKPCRSRPAAPVTSPSAALLRRGSPRPLRACVAVERACRLTFLLLLLLLLLAIVATGQSSQEPQCKPQEPTKYDWERLNYYELLGLAEEKERKSKKKKKPRKKGHAPSNGGGEEEEGSTIGIKEIRKAYRKQAQKYHPDKQVSKKKPSDEGSAKSSSKTKTISVEESNARFAKIAEAYKFLLDETKRRDYNLFLEYCQGAEIVKDDEVHEGRLSTILKKRFHGLFDDLVGSRDAFKVFKDVFFGGDDDDDDDFYFDPNDPFSALRYENNPKRHPNHQQRYPDEEPYDPDEEPDRVFHEKRFMYDPLTGENVVRVLQTEEFAPSSHANVTSRGYTRAGDSTAPSSFYYRIVAQDFREQYDPYNAKQVYVPIIEPYLQEDGFRTASASRDQPAESSSSSSASVESILHPWEVLTPSSPPMVSPNKRYIAGLSPDCELLVMLNPDRYGEDDYGGSHRDAPSEILWSTQRPYGNNGYVSDHCFALLKGPHLVVTVGQHPQQMGGSSSSHQNNRILWHSDGRSDEDDSRHGYYEYEDEFGFWHKRKRSYLAQLDNDGSLTVYSVWSVPQDDTDRGRHSLGRPVPRSKALASNVARAATDFWNGRIQTKNEFDHLYSTSRSLTYKRCVYSTHGNNLPLGTGCFRISRRLNQLAFEATLAVRKCIFHINVFADTWLDLIYEEDDIFYFFKESIRRNTLGSKVAGSSARWVRKVLEGLKQLSPKHQSRR